jgi:homoserine acetyltransferase
MRFPIVTMRDFVNVQNALADSLGVKKFAAVAGPSMGSLQVMEWAAAFSRQSGARDPGVARIKARVLAIPAKSDLLFYPDYTRKMVATLKAQGTHVEEFEIDGDGGHLDGVLDVAKAGEAIRSFLQE